MTANIFQRTFPKTSKLLKRIVNNRKDGAFLLFLKTISALEVLLKENPHPWSLSQWERVWVKENALRFFLHTLLHKHSSMAPFYHLFDSLRLPPNPHPHSSLHSSARLTHPLAAVARHALLPRRVATPLPIPLLRKGCPPLSGEWRMGYWKRVKSKLSYWKNYTKNAQKKIVSKATKMIPRNAVLITHSASGTVGKILIVLRKKIKKVYATESLPGGEGRIFARQLVASKVPVELLKDAMALEKVKSANLFLIGADAVCKKYFINKVGTKKIAQFAAKRNVPVAVACEKIKFVPQGMQIKAKKPLFERVPNTLVKYWITDEFI